MCWSWLTGSASIPRSAAVQSQYAQMQREAIAAGAAVIAAEAALDALFAGGTPTPQGIAAATEAAGTAQGALRAVHLRWHLATSATLTPRSARAMPSCAATPPARRPPRATGQAIATGMAADA